MSQGAPQHLAELRALADRYGLPVDTLVGRLGLRPREVSETLGVPLRTVQNWELPWVKVGRVSIIPMVDLLRFLESNRAPASARRSSRSERARALIEER